MARLACFLILILFSFSCLAETAGLDPRLRDFLEWEIKDKDTLEQTSEVYRSGGVDSETFILGVFTGAAKMDGTPDNSLMLSRLGLYVERKNPHLRPGLLLRMQDFMANPQNHTMMRSMFISTVTDNVVSR